MRLGLAIPHYDTSYAGAPASWATIATVARTAERAGFDSLWVSDHFFLDWSKYGGPADRQGSLECWTTMSAIAAVTERVNIGSLALCNDFRSPALVAKMAATLDVLSEGRVQVGLGAGWYEPEFEAAGIHFDRAGVRIERLGEAVEICRRLLAGEELYFTGKHYTIEGAFLNPGPSAAPLRSTPPPVWVGGKGDKLLATAARAADGWNFSWLGDFDLYRARAAAADQACERVGRAPASLRRSVGAYVVVGRNESDARSRYDRLARRTPPGVLTPSNGTPGVSWQEFRSRAVAGSADEVVDRLGSLGDLGVEEIIVTLGALPFQLADLDDVELAGTTLAPALNKAKGGNR